MSVRDIRVYEHSEISHSINYFYGCYDPLQYPLMYPHGEVGWHQGLRKNGVKRRKTSERSYPQFLPSVLPSHSSNVVELLQNEISALNPLADDGKCISMREYYAYKFQIRQGDQSCILQFGRLFQQFAVDMYVKLETQHLDYYATQQREIRHESLQGVVDAFASGDSNASQIGQRIVLPATFTGGPRHMCRRYMDAMSLVQKFGRPDLFLTMTCNPNWPEIRDILGSTEEAQNRSDLLVRVFHSKFEVLKSEILKRHCLGEVQAYTYVIEYQKRGLPHAHMLLILKRSFKVYRPEEYDCLVSAELPNQSLNPYLYKLVVKHMMHGPCGVLKPKNVCMNNDGECRYSYPKPYSSTTTQSENAYPIYRRRDDGHQVSVRGSVLDNRWVVPHSQYLLALIDCHINLEICSNIKAVKYIYKYICKGSDRILYRVSDNDVEEPVNEIKDFQSARWISAPEALWRIFSFPLGDMNPPVVRLPLHLENFQPLTFNKRQRLQNILNNNLQRETMLTQFFHMNLTSDKAKELSCTYNEFPDYFVWVPIERRWKNRQQKNSTGRIITAHPTEGERYCLRILLARVRCPTSYADLRTFNGFTSPTFREAALARGYLDNDSTQQACLSEASLHRMPYELRRLFSTLLVYACPSDPRGLWDLFESAMSEDFTASNSMSPLQIKKRVLQQISDFLQSMGHDISTFVLVPFDIYLSDPVCLTRELHAEYTLDVSVVYLCSRELLDFEQATMFNTIINKVEKKESGCFFVDRPGCTGKTYLYRAILADLRSKGYIALATASSGIAASILPGGRTTHSRFKIPIDLSHGSTCRVSKQSGLAMLIIESKLIIWDEAPMCTKYAIEALDTLLRDLMSSDLLFGGKVVVFGGDFRQTLPIIRNATKTMILNACLRSSFTWPHLTKLSLTENMRARTDPTFTSYLLSVGDGIAQSCDADLVQIPDSLLLYADDETSGLNKMIEQIYPDMSLSQSNDGLNRVILTTKNCYVDEINATLIARFPGEQAEYFSYDKVLNTCDEGQLEDYINTLTPNGLSPHKLVLKNNAAIILLKNVNPVEGLCNGTRMFIVSLNRNVIQSQISFGEFKGKTVFIHRISMQPAEEDNYPVPYKRTQFPIRLCFAMTINKAQGKTLDMVGVYLNEPVFSHGQLYVALSRAQSSANICVYIKSVFLDHTTSNKTTNIVYKEALKDEDQ